MTSRPIPRAISAAELTDDGGAVRRRLLDDLASAANRAPRLVTAPAEEVSVEAPAEAPVPATKRTRAGSAATRAKGTKTKAAKTSTAKASTAKTTTAKTVEAGAADVKAAEPDVEPEAAMPLEPPPISVAPVAPVAVSTVPVSPRRERTSRTFAVVAALALATVAAYFSVAGMAEIFPGDPVGVMVLAATMEAGKLVIAGWLAAHWRQTSWKMRSVMVALVAGLALINAAGVFGKLVEAHVSVAATARSGVGERIEALDARVVAQTAAVADLASRIAQIDRAVDESTRRGRVTRALNIVTQERATRDGLDTQRQAATAALVGLQAQRAALAGERSRIEASAGPIQYLAMMVGAAPEVAVRWLILLMVLCCDPAAIALTVAAAGSRARESR
ncbi:hypothetical protein [Bradyrhizobium sp. CB3481]|uniref:hypothetical protein n=1 Tax=Bradyrhizobium sp. CB3481 TaxID=3039158 RepID=UPI0024B1C982|nr:hypothetical protein [Bradyrhizobium sp. CB3481]WFU15414.1 hypothetical protein QA643_31215 [Bradyrhizobium sp. CB3481]